MAKPNSSHLNSICVYCGSADNLPRYYLETAFKMGILLAQNHIRLIYGAGKTGLMGAVADGCLSAGGEVTGVVPENLNLSALIHENLTQLEVTSDIHQRKARMSALADAFIALPGGFGTLDELFESLTWAQIGLHNKPVGLLNIQGYYDPLLAMVARAAREGFIFAEHGSLLIHDTDPKELLEKLLTFQRPDGLDRWVNR